MNKYKFAELLYNRLDLEIVYQDNHDETIRTVIHDYIPVRILNQKYTMILDRHDNIVYFKDAGNNKFLTEDVYGGSFCYCIDRHVLLSDISQIGTRSSFHKKIIKMFMRPVVN